MPDTHLPAPHRPSSRRRRVPPTGSCVVPPSAGGRSALLRPLSCLALIGALLLSVCAAASAQNSALGAAFGDTLVYRGCLKFTAVTYSDRQDTVDNHDWVTLRLRNECQAPLRNLLVELNLIDFEGHVYSDQVWLLDSTGLLLPRMTRLERYPIPDPDQRVAVRWGVRVLNLETNRREVPLQRRVTKAAAKAPFCILGWCL